MSWAERLTSDSWWEVRLQLPYLISELCCEWEEDTASLTISAHFFGFQSWPRSPAWAFLIFFMGLMGFLVIFMGWEWIQTPPTTRRSESDRFPNSGNKIQFMTSSRPSTTNYQENNVIGMRASPVIWSLPNCQCRASDREARFVRARSESDDN